MLVWHSLFFVTLYCDRYSADVDVWMRKVCLGASLVKMYFDTTLHDKQATLSQRAILAATVKDRQAMYFHVFLMMAYESVRWAN